MSYTTLVAPKGAAGSLANWVNYTKLDTQTILDEAQSLLYQTLRVREMRTEWTFGMKPGQSEMPLPVRFLDPIGRLRDITNGIPYPHRIEGDILADRAYEAVSGTLPANPFYTTAESSLVTVAKANHGLTQGSTISVTGATPFAGIDFNSSFPVTYVADDGHFVIDVEVEATDTVSGGGAVAKYSGSRLIKSIPTKWSIFDEKVKFDSAFDTATTFKHLYYRRPLYLSEDAPTNWLTDRYPMLLRKACMAAAADFMKDDVEYEKNITALNALIATTAAENDLVYRGAEFGTDNP